MHNSIVHYLFVLKAISHIVGVEDRKPEARP
jgi:hypothetical protein